MVVVPRRANGLLAGFVLAVVAGPALAHLDARDRVRLLAHEIEERPQEAGLYLERAIALVDRGRFSEALTDVGRARERGGDPVAASLVEATALLGAQQPIAAERVLDAALQLAPGDLRALRQRARARREQGRSQAAAEDLEAVVASSPDPSPDLILELSRDLRAAGRAVETLHWLEETLHRLGPSTALRREILAVEVELGRLQGALDRLDHWTATDPFPARWWVERALLLEGAGRRLEAGESWRAADAALTEQLRRMEGRQPLPLEEMAAEIAAGSKRAADWIEEGR